MLCLGVVKAMLLKWAGLQGRIKPSPAKFSTSCFDVTSSSLPDILSKVALIPNDWLDTIATCGKFCMEHNMIIIWFFSHQKNYFQPKKIFHPLCSVNKTVDPTLISVVCDCFKGGEQLNLGGPAFFLDSDGSLLISSPSGHESGEFICTATNAAGHVSRKVQLTVYGKCQMDERKYQIIWIICFPSFYFPEWKETLKWWHKQYISLGHCRKHKYKIYNI